MSSRFGFSISGSEGRTRTASRGGAGKPFMSPKQIEAYLVARDALRRIQRAASAPPSGKAFAFGSGTRGNDRRTLDS